MNEVASSAPDKQTRGLPSGGFGSLGSIIHLLILGWGGFLALLPLNDNSFFTHLATGRLILDRGTVPSADPYTFTAAGEPWTVQSWLASVGYATAERAGGAVGVRLLLVAVFLVAASLLWRLTRAASSIVPRLLLSTIAMVVCSGVFAERPYMVAFIGLCVLWTVLHHEAPRWVVVPLMWVWVNSHGSYPLAFVLCLTLIGGEILDQRRAGHPVEITSELRTFGAIFVGVLAGAISPLGTAALTFPLTSLSNSANFGYIVEWGAPDFQSVPERAFLVLVAASLFALVVTRRWKHAVPVAAFVIAALLARRNIVMAVPIIVPVIASALPRIGTLEARHRPTLGRPAAVVLGALLSLILVGAAQTAPLGLGGYPTYGLAYEDARAMSGRLVTHDFAGNLLEVLDGPTASVFVDDRADMFPLSLLEDVNGLNVGKSVWVSVLDRWNANTVIWNRQDPLGSLLASDPRWRVEFSDSKWIVATRR